MPIATPDKYNAMIDAAKAGGYAFPAVNVTSSQTLNAAIRGFAEAESDGIIQVSTGGAAYWAGASVKDMVVGSLAFAAFAREVAKSYGVNIALHTDHCPKDKLDGFVLPLLAASEAEVAAGRDPFFNSHMWDGSAETLQENLRIAAELLPRTAAAKQILEVEIGAVGGEEDGVEAEINDKLYTSPEDAIATVEALGLGGGAGIAVEDHAGPGVQLVERLADDAGHDLVRDEFARVHHGLGLEPDGRAGLDGGAQHVTGGYLRDAVVLGEKGGLGAFAGSGRTKQDNIHRRPPLSFAFLTRPSYWWARRWL